MRLDCKESLQNSGGNASRRWTIIHQKADLPPSKVLSPDVGVDDRLEMSEALTIVFVPRQSATGSYNIEEHLGGVLVVRAPRRSISFVYFGGTRQHHRRHRRRRNRCGDHSVVFRRKLATRVADISALPAERTSARRLRDATLTPRVATRWSRTIVLSLSRNLFLGCVPPSLVYAVSNWCSKTMPPLSTNTKLSRLLMRGRPASAVGAVEHTTA